MKKFRNLTLLLLALPLAGGILDGCGNQEADIKKAMETPKSEVERNKETRAIFDKVGGDAKKLTAEDRAKIKSLYPEVQGGVNIDGLFGALSRKASMPGAPTGK
jgi:hypothetical protein